VGFEPTISAFEREKTFHALDRAATVIGSHDIKETKTYLMKDRRSTLVFRRILLTKALLTAWQKLGSSSLCNILHSDATSYPVRFKYIQM
jgi:hypothetical protein